MGNACRHTHKHIKSIKSAPVCLCACVIVMCNVCPCRGPLRTHHVRHIYVISCRTSSEITHDEYMLLRQCAVRSVHTRCVVCAPIHGPRRCPFGACSARWMLATHVSRCVLLLLRVILSWESVSGEICSFIFSPQRQ